MKRVLTLAGCAAALLGLPPTAASATTDGTWSYDPAPSATAPDVVFASYQSGFPASSSARFTPDLPLTWSGLTELSAIYDLTVGDCYGGSLRWSVNFDVNDTPTNPSDDKSVYVYYGAPPEFGYGGVGGCDDSSTPPNPQSGVNLLALGDRRFDTRHLNGDSVFHTYGETRELVGDTPVTAVSLVLDSGWLADQVGELTSATVNDNAFSPAPFTPASLPPPVLHESANLYPQSGEVQVKEAGAEGFQPLTEPEQVSLGAIIDASGGHVDVATARNESGVVQSAEFWAGVFKVTQTEGEKTLTDLKLVGSGSASGRPGQALERRKHRRLWGRGDCKCRSSGRHSAGTARGTWWLTEELPNGTLTKVKRGSVKVRDFRLHKNVVVKAGQRYLARANPRPR